MCSFLFTNKEIIDFNKINFLLQKRGPDRTTLKKVNGFSVVHNLLSITGELTEQPLLDENFLVVYNGEIYNYKNLGDYNSDGFAIMDLYKQKKSFSFLDGEFAICVYDFINNEIILVTDTFGCKPLYYCIQDEFIGVSSYPTPLNLMGFKKPVRLSPNTILTIDSNTLMIKNIQNLYDFDLNQNINHYDFWVDAFIDSIKKRVDTKNEILVPMSSGYDSGAICAVLNIIKKDYISYSIFGRENQNVINDRLRTNTNTKKETISKFNIDEINNIKKIFRANTEHFSYGPTPDELTHDGFEDSGSIGLYHILEQSKKKYRTKIVLSGQGSDEIMSNIQTYGFKTKNPYMFPENLNDVFPWGNFYYGSQWSYLMKEECIGGTLGYETRYPYLDRAVVQNFLNLSPNLKNNKYKAPLNYFFNKIHYPFKEEKIGFQIN
jgi:asparagine synthetase B (glutamine-hydrolysing)